MRSDCAAWPQKITPVLLESNCLLKSQNNRSDGNPCVSKYGATFAAYQPTEVIVLLTSWKLDSAFKTLATTDLLAIKRSWALLYVWLSRNTSNLTGVSPCELVVMQNYRKQEGAYKLLMTTVMRRMKLHLLPRIKKKKVLCLQSSATKSSVGNSSLLELQSWTKHELCVVFMCQPNGSRGHYWCPKAVLTCTQMVGHQPFYCKSHLKLHVLKLLSNNPYGVPPVWGNCNTIRTTVN